MAVKRSVHHEILRYSLDGTPLGQLTLPTLGTVSALSGQPGDAELLLGFELFLAPLAVLRYDFAADQLTTWRAAPLDFPADDYVTEQVFFRSKDGTAVPMFIVHKKGLARNGRQPTLLYGYGGFNISLLPYFSAARLVWLEQGGVFALANIRGGDEYGEAWHQAGMLDRKQSVFDDFIAAAEWLIASGYTSAPHLACMGGSNGGLLVAACMLQRPELWGAVVCQVPVIDMLHYHQWTVGRYWVGEYGNAEADPEQFKFMLAYSPLHNVQPDAVYPPLLITSADTDDRVVPAHAKKFAATLQAAGSSVNPLLLRVEMKAGHGLGKPTAKVIQEASDIYAFLFKHCGIAEK